MASQDVYSFIRINLRNVRVDIDNLPSGMSDGKRNLFVLVFKAYYYIDLDEPGRLGCLLSGEHASFWLT